MNPYSFMLDSYSFISVNCFDFVINKSIIPLFNKYKNIITDDYWVDSPESILNLIKTANPYFWACYNEKEQFIGFMFLLDWKSGGTSCEFHIVIDDKFHGHTVHKVAKKVAKELMDRFSIRRISCTIPCYNKRTIAFAKRVLGAKFEGVYRGYSQKNGKPLDYLGYSLLDTDFKNE